GALAELREDLLERALAEAADGPGRDGEEAGLLVALEVAAVLELLDEVAEPHPVGVVVGEAVLLVELGEPAERLGGVPPRVVEELLEEVEQRVEGGAGPAVAALVPLRVAEAHGVEVRSWKLEVGSSKGRVVPLGSVEHETSNPKLPTSTLVR